MTLDENAHTIKDNPYDYACIAGALLGLFDNLQSDLDTAKSCRRHPSIKQIRKLVNRAHELATIQKVAQKKELA